MPEQIRKTRFTLVEMITVLVVVTIMMGMGVAALRGGGRYKGSESGARIVSRMLELTRQYAITKNTRVALMMPMTSAQYTELTTQMPKPSDLANAGHPTGDPVSDTPGIALRPAIVDRSNTFLGWVKDSKWEVFPSSIYFTSDPATASNALVDITFTETESSAVIVNGLQKGIVFKGNGSLVGSKDATIYIKPFNTTPDAGGFDPGKAAVYEINVSWLTGKVVTTQWRKAGSSWTTIE